MFLALALTVGFAGKQISGDAAVKGLRDLLSGFGVGPVRLQKLTDWSTPRGRFYSVAVTDNGGVTYEAALTTAGRAQYIESTSKERGDLDATPRGLAGSPYEKRVRAWLAKVGTTETTELERMVADGRTHGTAYFAIVRNGHPFVGSTQQRGYRFIFSLPEGKFLSYWSSESIPPINPAPAQLTKEQALVALQRIYEAKNAAEKGKPHPIRYFYKIEPDLKLGYFVPEGENTARLVWLIHFMAYRDIPNWAVQGGSNGMVIDAVTGKQIQTSEVP